MAWIYLAASGDSVWPYQIGSNQSPIVKMTDTLKQFCYHEWPTERCRETQFGPMLKRCEDICSRQSTSFTGASRVKTLALWALESAWAESEAGFFSTSQGLSAKQTRDLYFSKTSQQLELVASTVSCKHLPSSGMIVAGRLYQPKKLAPRTFVNDGSYLPTPTACDYGKNNGRRTVNERDRYSLTTMARHNLWPTPCARDYRTGDKPNSIRQQTREYSPNLNDVAAPGGQLNPTWIEWLMGYPTEWTALEPWATQWFRSKRKSRSKDCVA